jgi:RecB family exonuclease
MKLSFSRLDRFERCPLSYRLHYVEKRASDPSDAAAFGSAIHAALEELVREHVHEERSRMLSEERAAECWQHAFAKAGLRGADRFEEGLELLRAFVREQGVVDAHDILAVEQPFEIRLGDIELIGVLDRADRVDDETVRIIDYKSNRLLFTRDEVDTSLQMSIYHLAALELWPWAKRVQLSFWMLRHGVHQEAERTPEQLDAARRYVQALARAIATASEFPARPNPNCVWCDHRRECPAYAAGLAGKRDHACEDSSDLEAVAREREEVARTAKIAYARRDELDKVLRAHLDQNDELVLGGTRYALFKVTQRQYPLSQTVAVLHRETGLDADEITTRIAVVENKALDKFLKQHASSLGRSRSKLLKVELDSLAKTTHSSRIWGKAIPSRGDAATDVGSNSR